MAIRTSTYRWIDVITAASQIINRNVEEKFAVAACQMGLRFLWNSYDFRDTLGQLPPFFLIPNRQDYGPPFSTVPSDFYGLRRAWLKRLTSDPAEVRQLSVLADVKESHVWGIPRAIGFIQEHGSFRLFPRPPETMGCPEWAVYGSYKKRVPRITADSLMGDIPVDPELFEPLAECVRWAFLRLAGDQRAGGVSWNSGQKIYTGQAAVAKLAVDEAAEAESANSGDIALAPESPANIGPGLFYWWW